ncbi:hypothetical protein [Streptomyces albipurpureus]|uniref:Uncharacterized protein n=1 Tax=Streptomyces albipurpureus TaxID=2897419 RepID=A0ABT0V0Y1_9ACTN|nr:hypothetical protein [Streptomyces sp. CWNU-1]MCM2394410.1 hypothetical protein [Streptomyces sp. CWNU-1]
MSELLTRFTRRGYLLTRIQEAGGIWTTQRASTVLAHSPWGHHRNTVRKDLRALARAGRVVAKDSNGRRTYIPQELTVERPETASVELSDGGRLTLTGWSLTELAPDYYGISHMQIGGWLPEDWDRTSVPWGTNQLIRAELPGEASITEPVNVEVEAKYHGTTRAFIKIQWPHARYPADWLTTLRTTGKLPVPIDGGASQ